MSEEERERGKGFRVTDRRRFSPDSGEPRPTSAEEDATHSAHSQASSAESAKQETPPSSHSSEDTADQVEISFSSFVLGLSTQALMYLGEVPAPPGEAIPTDLAAAQQMIDVLAMLQQKTSGNLDTGEQQMLESVLYDLRMRYVKLKREGRSA